MAMPRLILPRSFDFDQELAAVAPTYTATVVLLGITPRTVLPVQGCDP